jgi:glycosyltransferase involved in cell wall biosynthesis
MKVALVHDWLVTYRGGEKVLAAIAELYPGADLFTLIHQPGPFPQILENRPIHTSFLQRVPGINRRYRYFLPLFPAAVGSLDLRGFDLVISSSHCAAKGVRKPPGARHLCYVHAPMRYMWDRFDDYFGKGRASWPTRAAARLVRPALQSWDRTSSDGVDRFLANSHYVAQKIADLYGRPAQVVPPPVELERFAALPANGGGQGGYFLSVGALAPYKRLDIAIEAFGRLKLPLWVVGSGQEGTRLRASVPANVKMLGQVSDQELPGLYHRARALIFTADEDFGIAPLEAQAAGRPVIALRRGGALETLTPRTGLFFERQTADSLANAVIGFESWEADFDPAEARVQASRFTKANFQRRFTEEVEQLIGTRPSLGKTARA